MKKGIVILGLISAMSLSACGSIPVLNSSSDDSEVIAQSKAVIEQSKAVVEESKALEKAKGNNDNVKEMESEKTVSSGEISHPFLTLECEGEKFDIANYTVRDFVYLSQKMKYYPDVDLDLSQKIEPYGSPDYSYVYNPYNKEIALKDAKVYRVEFRNDIFDGLKFLNGKGSFDSTFEELLEVFKEDIDIIWDESAYDKARKIAKENGEEYTGPYPPEDDYANVLDYWENNDKSYWIEYKFRLDDGRRISIGLSGNKGDLESIEFELDPYYE